jgi:tripartite-type tricarboxylate transporter receptor subunit TctC
MLPADAGKEHTPMKFVRHSLALAATILAPTLLAIAPASAQNVEQFYAHHQIRMIVGYSTGGGYDLYARLLSRYLGNHLPGKPTILPENMPGAGSLRAANYLYAAAPKDGSAIGTFSRGLAMEALLNHSQGVMFQVPNFNWLGSITDEVSVCAFRTASGVLDWHDMQTKSYTVGGTASGSDTDIFPTVLRNMFGLKMKLVTGFPGGADVNLALQRGEVDGRCGWSWSSLISRDRQMLDSKLITITLQVGVRRHEDLPNVPLMSELTDDPQKKAVLTLISSRQAMARPFVAPPGIPADRLKALDDAFDATMKDPAFLAEAKSLDLEVHPVDAKTLTELVQQIYASKPETLKLAAQVLGEGN